MHVQDLIFKLKHGYSYLDNSTDPPVQQLVAPNKYMLRASEVIERAIQDNNKLLQQIQYLQTTLDKTLQELIDAKAQIQHQSGLSQHGATAGPGTANSGSSQGQTNDGQHGTS
jgi:hypothetical protein